MSSSNRGTFDHLQRSESELTNRSLFIVAYLGDTYRDDLVGKVLQCRDIPGNRITIVAENHHA
ncbi:MAG TPA: hypothetical protein DDW52_25180 [Planctomycetaceae bacterium]|nr:hypothetical protein [Planctomycetaceae bacterium]